MYRVYEDMILSLRDPIAATKSHPHNVVMKMSPSPCPLYALAGVAEVATSVELSFSATFLIPVKK